MSDILDAFKETSATVTTESDGRRLRIGIIGCGGVSAYARRRYRRRL